MKWRKYLVGSEKMIRSVQNENDVRKKEVAGIRSKNWKKDEVGVGIFLFLPSHLVYSRLVCTKPDYWVVPPDPSAVLEL